MLLWYWFFFFKQKTAYEMRISDWSSDVCSSDLIVIDHFLVVVGPAYPAKAERHQQHDPHEPVSPVRPQQGAHSNGNQDQHAAHGRRPVLLQMRFGAVRTHSLANFQFGKLADPARPGNQPHKQRRDAGPHPAKRTVFKKPKT